MAFPGDERLSENPNWGPLERVVGRLNLCAFMYIGRVLNGEKTIFLYKHIVTRGYLNLDEAGQAYRYRGGAYLPLDLDRAIAYVFKFDESYRAQNRHHSGIDITELSELYPYPGKVSVYFVVIDSEIDLCRVASTRELGSTSQLKSWT